MGSEADKPVTSASGPCSQALWTPDGAAVVYPCHAVIVVLHIETREQRLFLGHTEKVGSPGLGQPGLLAHTLPNSLPPGLCSGAGRERLAAGLSPGLAPQHAASLGLPDGELPGPVPEPSPHCLLPQVGAGPSGGVGANPGDADCRLCPQLLQQRGAALRRWQGPPRADGNWAGREVGQLSQATGRRQGPLLASPSLAGHPHVTHFTGHLSHPCGQSCPLSDWSCSLCWRVLQA